MTDYLKLIKLQEAKEMAKYDNVENPEHYKQYENHEPIDVRQEWNLPPMVDSALKYIARYRFKGKPIEDLEKAIKCLKKEVTYMRNKTFAEHTEPPVIEEGEDG